MRHFPTNCYNGAHLDVFRQPSPLSLSLLNVLILIRQFFILNRQKYLKRPRLIDKNPKKTALIRQKYLFLQRKEELNEMGDRIGAALRYNITPNISVQMSVESRRPAR